MLRYILQEHGEHHLLPVATAVEYERILGDEHEVDVVLVDGPENGWAVNRRSGSMPRCVVVTPSYCSDDEVDHLYEAGACEVVEWIDLLKDLEGEQATLAFWAQH